jgi:RND family efflux transporter MFP subunit
MLLTLSGSTLGCGGGAESGPPPPPDVGVARPIKRDVTLYSEHLGSTEAYEAVEVRARVSGELEEITFQPSTFVEEGEQLFVIEPRLYKAERDAADAALKSAEAELARAESDLKRVEQAVKTNAVSESDVDLARADRDMARASVLSAEAQLDAAELQYSYTQVRSPIAGQVGRNRVDRGNIVDGSQGTLLTTVNRVQPMFVYFDAPEEIVLRALQNLDLTTLIDRERVESGEVTRAEVATLIDEGYPYDGPIDYISNTVDPDTGTIQLRAVLTNESLNLFPGLFVRVRIPVGLLEDAVLIREEALGTDLGGRYVYVVGEGNVVEQVYVELGPVEPDGMVPVTDGLDGSETYIVDGMLRARPGMPVTPETVSSTREATASGETAKGPAEAASEDEVEVEPAGEDG